MRFKYWEQIDTIITLGTKMTPPIYFGDQKYRYAHTINITLNEETFGINEHESITDEIAVWP